MFQTGGFREKQKKQKLRFAKMEVTKQTKIAKGSKMDFNKFLDGIKLSATEKIEPKSRCAALEKVTDKRGKKGRLYRACIVLTLLVLAKMAGKTTPTAIARWIRLRQDWLCKELNLKRKQLPCGNTYVYVCEKCELSELNAELTHFFSNLNSSVNPSHDGSGALSRGSCHLGMDGKSLVSTLKSSKAQVKPVHLLELYEVNTGIVLEQINVEKKQSEVTVAPRLLEGKNLQGCLISADAFHTQREWCKLVKQKEGDWLLIAKANQPALVEDLSRMFQDEEHWPEELDLRKAQSWDKGHGRLEHRRISISSDMKDYLGERWVGVEQVFRVERQIWKQGKERQEVVYGMISLPAEIASAEQVLGYLRQHWWIENRLHWRKDVTLNEDACLTRRGQVPIVLATINNAVLAWMDFLNVKNVPQQMDWFGAFPSVALNLLVKNIIL